MNSSWTNFVGELADELICNLFNSDDSKSENDLETIDLGYAILVDDEGNEI